MSPRAPRSYDEISRHTVIEPDGSWRPEPPPTEAEIRLDRQIREAVSDALIAYGIDTVGFEVNRSRLILRGTIPDLASSLRIERLLAAAAPEALIDNRLRIGPR